MPPVRFLPLNCLFGFSRQWQLFSRLAIKEKHTTYLLEHLKTTLNQNELEKSPFCDYTSSLGFFSPFPPLPLFLFVFVTVTDCSCNLSY